MGTTLAQPPLPAENPGRFRAPKEEAAGLGLQPIPAAVRLAGPAQARRAPAGSKKGYRDVMIPVMRAIASLVGSSP